MVQRGVLSVDASLSARLAEQPPIPNHAMGPIPNQQRLEGVEGRGGHDWPTRRDLETLPGPNVPVVPRLWGWTWDAVKHDRTRLLRCGRCAGATSCFEGHSKKVTLCGLQSFLAHTGPSDIHNSCLALLAVDHGGFVSKGPQGLRDAPWHPLVTSCRHSSVPSPDS